MSGAFSPAGYGNVQLFPVWVTHCSTVGAGSVKEQGFTHTLVEIRIGVSGPCQHLCSQERGVSMKAGPRRD